MQKVCYKYLLYLFYYVKLHCYYHHLVIIIGIINTIVIVTVQGCGIIIEFFILFVNHGIFALF